MEDLSFHLKRILEGGTLEDKLSGSELDPNALDFRGGAPFPILDAPGRDGVLKPGKSGDSAFPREAELRSSTRARGLLLHFFANHELLAIETMAYVLLRFPEAPESFKKGVYRVLQEEQKHLSAYLERMREYGVEFGEVPLSFYFWNSLKNIRSPLEFAVQMGLTFEQANLDFALEYAELFEKKISDPKTASLLRRVHEDEVRHVAHGWKWFQTLKDPDRSDFDAYRDSLPFPMTPRRARGARIFAESSRVRAGLSPEFIRRVRIAGGSRGKVPDFYFFNPGCELEDSLSTLPKILQSRIRELAPLTLWLSKEGDVVELPEHPGISFLEGLHEVRGELPEIIVPGEDLSRFRAFGAFRPWGFSRAAWDRFSKVRERFRSPPKFDSSLHRELLFSKAYWKRILGTPGDVVDSDESFRDWAERVQDQKGSLLLKSAKSSSGRGHLRIECASLQDPSVRMGLEKRLKREGAFVAEPWLDKISDFSVQYEIRDDGTISEFAPRFFQNDSRFQYAGSWLGKGGGDEGLVQSAKNEWRSRHQEVLDHLMGLGYAGPVGVDCMVVRTPEGILAIDPVIEVNVRFTMGRVAVEVERAIRKTRNFQTGILVFANESVLASRHFRSFRELEEQMASGDQKRFIALTESQGARGSYVFALLDPTPAEIQSWGFSAT